MGATRGRSEQQLHNWAVGAALGGEESRQPQI